MDVVFLFDDGAGSELAALMHALEKKLSKYLVAFPECKIWSLFLSASFIAVPEYSFDACTQKRIERICFSFSWDQSQAAVPENSIDACALKRVESFLCRSVWVQSLVAVPGCFFKCMCEKSVVISWLLFLSTKFGRCSLVYRLVAVPDYLFDACVRKRDERFLCSCSWVQSLFLVPEYSFDTCVKKRGERISECKV